MSDPDLHEMDNESLLAAARMVASILRDTGNDPNPESSADLLTELADRLEAAELYTREAIRDALMTDEALALIHSSDGMLDEAFAWELAGLVTR